MSAIPANQLWRSRPDSYAQVASGGQWRPYPWLQYLSGVVADAVRMGNGRIIINAPPQHGKSNFISQYVPSWYLDLFPRHRVILTTHTANYAASWGRKVRNTIRDFRLSRVHLAPDSAAADEWSTTLGGGMLTAGVTGGTAGRPGELIICDDPIPDWEHAYSHAYRQLCVDWFDSTLYARRQPGTTIILLMTRWHPEDLTGYLLTRHPDKWTHICLPAIAEDADILGRPLGAPLCPERFTAESLKSSQGNAAVWAAMYQQNPKHIGVGLVYDNFTPANIDSKVALVRGRPLQVAIDFNINPGMHCELGQYDENADQLITRHEIHGPGMPLIGALKEMWKIYESYGPGFFPMIEIFGDASGNARSTQTAETSYDLIKSFLNRKSVGYHIRVPSANPPIRERVDTLQEAIRDIEGVIHYRIHPDCKRLRLDLEELRRGEDGLPDKHSDSAMSHASDASGYAVARLRPIARQAVNQQRKAMGGPRWQAIDPFG